MNIYTFAPDLDPTTDGIVVDCDHVVPSIRGLMAAPGAADAGYSTVTASVVIGGASLLKLDGNSRTFAGTNSNILELSGTSWTTVAKAGGYTAVTDRWRFAQYGNVSLAVSRENVLNYSNASGAFAIVTSTASGATVTAPAGAIVEVVNDFIFMGDISTGPSPYNADQSDRWWCSALGDYSDWTPALATQSATGRLTSVPGKITAMRRFGDQIIAYKLRGMYVGSYTGGTAPIWSFQEVPSAAGAWCQEAVCNIGTAEQPLHFFVGEEDFYLFDGARPAAIGEGVREFFFDNLNVASANKIVTLLDRRNSLVYIYYPSGGATSPNACLVLNFKKRRWGVDNRSIEFAWEFLSPGLQYDNLGSSYSTYDDLPSGTYDSVFQSASQLLPAVVGTDHKLYTLTGMPQAGSFTTGDWGSEEAYSLVSRLEVRFISAPSGAQLTNYTRASLGEPLIVGTTTSWQNGRFDLLAASKFHRFAFSNVTGNWETNRIVITAVQQGLE